MRVLVNHRLVVDRHELIADGLSDRVKPRTLAASEDGAPYHFFLIYSTLMGSANMRSAPFARLAGSQAKRLLQLADVQARVPRPLSRRRKGAVGHGIDLSGLDFHAWLQPL